MTRQHNGAHNRNIKPHSCAIAMVRIKYVHDYSYNLLQRSNFDAFSVNRWCAPKQCNRSVLPTEMAAQVPDFDRHGNRLQLPALNQISWTPTNMLNQVTKQNNAEGLSITEYHVYAGKKRTRKITETKDNDGKVIKIRISEYFGKIEKQTIYAASNQKLPQLVVNEQELKTYSPSIIHHLYIKIGHRQIARQSTCNLEHSTVNLEFHLSNHIDSSQAILTSSGELKSFQSFYPYGSTSFQYGQLKDKNYQYSGEEKDDTGLHYYGARYYDSENLLSWLSPDPAGYPDGHLNRYTMVRGNPVTYRDDNGTTSFKKLNAIIENWLKKYSPGNRWTQDQTQLVSAFYDYEKNIIIGIGELHDKTYKAYDRFYKIAKTYWMPDVLFIESLMHATSLITYYLISEWDQMDRKRLFEKTAYGGLRPTKIFMSLLEVVQVSLSNLSGHLEDPMLIYYRIRSSFKNQLNLRENQKAKFDRRKIIQKVIKGTSLRGLNSESNLREEIIFLTKNFELDCLQLANPSQYHHYKPGEYTSTLQNFVKKKEGRIGFVFGGAGHFAHSKNYSSKNVENLKKAIDHRYAEGKNTLRLIERGIVSYGIIPREYGEMYNMRSQYINNDINLVSFNGRNEQYWSDREDTPSLSESSSTSSQNQKKKKCVIQ